MQERGKTDLRRHFRQQRRTTISLAAAGILEVALHELPSRVPDGEWLGLYWPLADEPDLRILAETPYLQVALPAAQADDGLAYLPWRPQAAVGPDTCGIPAPLEGPPLNPEAMALLLVPALAVTPRGWRLGSGGGWYDRLRADPRWRAVPALAVLPAACVTPELPLDSWDVPFSGWLDENGIHWVDRSPETIARV
ncbi:5-formyltetrahydrofolate cyclo-ligase [Synechococcus sp. CCY 9618]|uniref:5-formyltetrahydrofolate cyclo-ligase n=1 Tax=Synechococcus sp. CCY 9618 TaxID=2815602 RepID=UPI0020B1F878|nr:5-formyltetrahydrofolate cyclo-ligase [Synechococcus sp. CCY 9618]